jgi:hypothetical protein
MVGELAVEPNGAVRFVLPTVLKPRYTPSGSTDPLSPATSTSGSTSVHHTTGPSEYEFNLVINGAAGIEEVTSPSHEIRVENAGQNINVSLAEDKQTDIVILVQPVEAHKPLVIVEPGWSNGENDFEKNAVIMVSFFPEFKGDTSCLQAACEFVFVVDRSGSMSGSYIKDAAQTILEPRNLDTEEIVYISYSVGGSTTNNPLERIINLQLANGAWKLSAELIDAIAKTTGEIKDACPVPCQGEMETIWATVIVLMYLQLRQSNFKDEWELVAAKAEAWLTKQNLPQGCSTQVLREKGTAFLS